MRSQSNTRNTFLSLRQEKLSGLSICAKKLNEGGRDESDIEKSSQNSENEGKEKPRKKLKFRSNVLQGESENVEGHCLGFPFTDTEPLLDENDHKSSTKTVWKKVVVSIIMQNQ